MKQLICILFFGFSYSLLSQIKYVPTDYSMIQQAINESKDGDTIIVEEGVYAQQINFMGKAITVGSKYILDGEKSHIENTIIDGMFLGDKDSSSLVYFINGEDSTSVLSGLTLQNGKGTKTKDIFIYKETWLIGGAICVDSSGASILNNYIKDNSLFIDNYLTTKVKVFGGAISSNYVPKNKKLLIKNNSISNNMIQGKVACGGGIDIFSVEGYVKIMRNRIIGNGLTANESGYGGGISVCENHDNVLIENNYIASNKTYSSNGHSKGAGIAAYFSEPIIRNNIIVFNKTDYPVIKKYNAFGGGIAVFWNIDDNWEWKVDPYKLFVKIENNTIAYNNDQNAGGGLAFRDVGASLKNNIIGCNFSDNDAQIKYEFEQTVETKVRSLNVSYCNIEGGYDGEGNINKFPQFTDKDHWYLKQDLSPCIDAGNPENKYDDIEDPNEIGEAYFPALGGLRNDIGAFGGPYSNWSEDILTDLKNEQFLLPQKIELSQNYPNPFNPITTIKYQIPLEVKSQKSKVKNVVLKIFDILGREIVTLVNAKQEPGNYEITWDASNQTSGIYFYKLQTGNFTNTKKMILLK